LAAAVEVEVAVEEEVEEEVVEAAGIQVPRRGLTPLR
jgi:hypothetical protein